MRSSPAVLNSLRVLVVENSAANAEQIALAMDRADVSVHCHRVATETDFLAHLDAEPDLVIAGDNLPHFDARRALYLVRERHFDVPFVLVAEHMPDDLAADLLAEGATEYLPRNRLDRLGKTVDLALERKRQRQGSRAGGERIPGLPEEAGAKADVLNDGQRRLLEMIASGAPLREILTSLVTFIESQSNEMLGSILLLDEDGIHARHIAAPNLPSEYVERIDGFRIGPNVGSCGAAMYHRQTAITTDIESDPRWADYRALAAAFGLRACWSTPIVSHRNQVLGSLAMYYRTVRAPNRAEQRLIDIATHIAGIAIERNRAEQALRRQKDFLDKLVRHLPLAVFVKNARDEFRYELVNQKAADLLGLVESEVIGRHDFEIHRRELAEFFRAKDEEAIALGTPIDIPDEPYQLKRSKALRLHTIKVPLYDECGNPSHLLGIAQDISDQVRAERALRESEQRYRLLFERNLAGVFRTTPEGKIVDCNEAFARIFGYARRDDILSHNAFEFYFESGDRELLIAKLRDCGHLTNLESRCRCKDGSPVWVLENLSLVTDAEDQMIMEGTVVDITDLKRAEEALQESEARYRMLFERNPCPTWVYDLETLEFLAVNEAAVAHYGYSRDEFLHMTIQAINMPDKSRSHNGSLPGPAVRQEQAVIRRHRRKDGSIIDVEITSHWLNFGGRPARQVLVKDVTERRRVDSVRERLLAILEATTDLVAISQVEGPASYVNAAGRRLLGVGPNDEVALTDHRPESARRMILKEAIPTAIRKGAWSGETVLIGRDGNEVPVSQVLIAHKNSSGNVEFLSTIARDIREQKRLEEQFRQAQKMEAFGSLAGGIAHDFSNLLTVIIGYSQFLLGRLSGDEVSHGFVSEIKKSADRATALTRQLLAFSRRQLLQPREIDLNTVVADMSKLLHRLIGEDVHLATRLDPQLHKVRADPGQVEQVILNLAVNARDAMPTGGNLTIETRNVHLDESYASTHVDVRPGQYAMLAVSDSGLGMSPEVKARIFEPFFTTKEVGKGTGLGLATVYGVVKQSGGHVEVYSEQGKGTSFKVYLPRMGKPEPRLGSDSGSFVIPTGRETILLAEDETGVRMLASMALKARGYSVLEARDGREALKIAETYQGPIHLLLTDVVMPNLGGRQLAEQVAKLRPDTLVLYMSGYTDDAVVRHGVLQSNVCFMQKPFTPDSLSRKVREVIDQASILGR
jgi:PAS domain S-box-containing protein